MVDRAVPARSDHMVSSDSRAVRRELASGLNRPLIQSDVRLSCRAQVGSPIVKNVAVVGASGAVGDRMIRLLEERAFPVASIKFLASERSAGKTVTFRGETYPIEPIAEEAFRGVEIVLSSTPGAVSREWSPIAAAAGAVVVDNSSAFRMDPNVPLVVPEVNPHDVAWNKGIIANPNCSTIQMVVALKPLHDAGTVRRVVVSTYQSVSGRRAERDPRARDPGRSGRQQGAVPAPSKFAHPIIGNCIPHIDEFVPSGYTKEEMKMVHETRKIMGDATIDVCPTCVRVPVPFCHSESILVETERPITVEEARTLWARPRASRWWTTRHVRSTPWPPMPPDATTSSSAGFART